MVQPDRDCQVWVYLIRKQTRDLTKASGSMKHRVKGAGHQARLRKPINDPMRMRTGKTKATGSMKHLVKIGGRRIMEDRLFVLGKLI